MINAVYSDKMNAMPKQNPRKPKVLNVGYHPPPPGGMANFIDNFEQSGIKNLYQIRGFDTDYPRWLKKLRPLTVLYLPIMYLHYLWALITFQPDVIHVHTPAFNAFYKHAVFVKIARERKTPVAFHIHAGKFKEFYDNLKESGKRDVRKKLKQANLLIVLSNYWKDFFTGLYPSEKIRIVENGIPVDKFSPADKANRTKSLNFIYVGRLLEQKGIDELLEAAHEVFRIYPDSHLTIAGGEEVARFKRKSDKLGLSENVTFTGEVVGNSLIELYQSANIFVLPSHAEGMPLVLLEAMSVGLACIATDVGAIPEVLNDSGGIIIPPKDVHALNNAMLELAGNPDKVNSMGIENRNIILRDFSFDVVAEKMRIIYDELILVD